MDFISALAHLKNGIKMRRPGWDSSSFYYYDGGIFLHCKGLNDARYTCIPVAEIEARDWEEYKEPVKTETVLCRNLRDGDIVLSEGHQYKIRYINVTVKYEELRHEVQLHMDREVERLIK